MVGMEWPLRPAVWLLLLALMSVPGLGREKEKKPDPFAELPDTKMITVEYSMGPLIPPSSRRTTEPNNEQPDPTQKSAQEVLESYGIHFPKGAKADYNSAAGSLRVTQTINNVKGRFAISSGIQNAEGIGLGRSDAGVRPPAIQ